MMSLLVFFDSGYVFSCEGPFVLNQAFWECFLTS